MKRVMITNHLVLLLFWSNVNKSETGSSAALPWSGAACLGVGLVPLLRHVEQPWLWFTMGHRARLVTLLALTDGATLVLAGWTRIHHLHMLGRPPPPPSPEALCLQMSLWTGVGPCPPTESTCGQRTVKMERSIFCRFI